MLNIIQDWYHHDFSFHQDFLTYRQGNHISPKEKGRKIFKNFTKPQNHVVYQKTNLNQVNWMEHIKNDLWSLSQDRNYESNFMNHYENHKTHLRPLTEQEKQGEKESFCELTTQQDIQDWLNSSLSLSNKLLGWWLSKLLSNNVNNVLIVSEIHHIMPRYMANWGIPEVKVESPINLIKYSPGMHALIHAIRFIEYQYQEDYLVIGRIHYHIKGGNNLIRADQNQTIMKLIENNHLFYDAFRQAKFSNLPDVIQKTFEQDMEWQGRYENTIKTIHIKEKSVATYAELICVLHAHFRPDQEPIIPTESYKGAARKYLLGQRSSMGHDGWKLVNINDNMLKYYMAPPI